MTTYVTVGAEPYGVASNGNNIYISNNVAFANGDPATVKVVNAANNTVSATVPVGISPAQVVYDPNSARIYVANSAYSSGINELKSNDLKKSLSVIDPATNTVIATIPLQYNPYSVAVWGNKAYVCTGSTIEVIDLSSNTVEKSIPVPQYSSKMVAVNGYILLASNNLVTIIKTDTSEIVGSLNIANPITGMSLDSDTGIVYALNSTARTVSAFRLIVPGFSISTNAQSLAATAGGSTAFTATVTSIDGFSGAVSLGCEGLPTGATCQFAQNPVTVLANNSVSTMLTVTVPAGTVAGPYSLRVVGSGNMTQNVASNFKATLADVTATTTLTDFQNLSLTVPSCDFALSAQSISVGASANTGSVNVTGTTGCSWTAVSNDAWISITSGANGSSNGTVNYSIAANTGAQRVGTITIAGQTLTVRQVSSACGAITVAPVNLPSGLAGVSYNQTIMASGSTAPPYTFTSTALPPGLSLSSTGVLSGTPTTVGSYTFTVTATDMSANSCVDNRSYSFFIGGGTSLGTHSLASTASYGATEAAVESVVTAFGARLSVSLLGASTSPLPTSLGNTAVNVRDSANVDRAAGIYFVTPDRVNFQIPVGTATGLATITISNLIGYSTGTIQIIPVAPAFFSADSSGTGVLKGYAIRTVGATQTIAQVARFDQATLRWVAVPLAQPTNQVTLVLLGTGFRNRSSLGAVSATVGGMPVTVVSAGASSTTIGFDELRLQLPTLTSGSKDIVVTVDGKTANTVKVQIQ